jgi:hypothetical protein
MYWIEMPSGAERARLRHASKRVLIGMVDGAIEIASSSTATTVTRRRRLFSEDAAGVQRVWKGNDCARIRKRKASQLSRPFRYLVECRGSNP